MTKPLLSAQLKKDACEQRARVGHAPTCFTANANPRTFESYAIARGMRAIHSTGMCDDASTVHGGQRS